MAQKIRLPASEGGLVRYYDEEYQAKFILKPEVIVGICIAAIIFGIIVTIYGPGWFGL